VLFYLLLAFWVIVGLPTLLMPRWGAVTLAQCWARSSIWLMRVVCNTKVEYRGVEKIPEGPLIVASKHQSMWETFALLQFFPQPLYILKRELKWIPFFGWYLLKTDMIGVDRGAGGRSLIEMARRAGAEVRRGRQLIIFPEGTRTAALQDRRCPGLRRLRRAVFASCSQFRIVLAAPHFLALSRDDRGRVSRFAATRPHASGIHRAGLDRDR
jgi:1-acyl-sn-glycerol-3-phosphate acyltransferase